jgi:hypothetical protein
MVGDDLLLQHAAVFKVAIKQWKDELMGNETSSVISQYSDL